MRVVHVRFETSDKWVRALVGDTAVVDSRAPILFWDEAFPIPSYAFPREDFRTDLLRPAAEPSTPGSNFFGPKGPVAEWFDLHLDGRILSHAAWVLDDADVRDRIVLTWQPGVIDHWFEEDEEVFGHPRDPHKRVDALQSSRHVTVALEGVALAETHHPVLLFETGLPTRYYFPRGDVDFDRLTSSGQRSLCPYKGRAEEYWDAPGATGVAWSYAHPYPAVDKIAGLVAFYNELVDITVDDKPLPRPESVFSSRENRPTEI